VQERSFERLSGTKTVAIDVRILASTQVPLEPLVEAGAFRNDLFYRLNVIRLELPPLRERLEDVPVLAEEMLRELARRPEETPKRLSPAALDRLLRHDWPGNVRELRNVLESAVIRDDGAEIPSESIRIEPVPAEGLVAEAAGERLTLAQIEERYIREVLRLTRGNRTEAARVLGINRKTLLEKRKRYGIP